MFSPAVVHNNIIQRIAQTQIHLKHRKCVRWRAVKAPDIINTEIYDIGVSAKFRNTLQVVQPVELMLVVLNSGG